MSKQVENIVENLPSNKQLEKGLETVKKELQAARTAPGVDSTGQQILSDTEHVLTDTERLIREKNEGDKVQELIREGQKAAIELQRQADKLKSAGIATSIDAERLKELAEKTLDTARLLGIELLSSTSFRNSLLDFIGLCYDIIAEGTGATEKVKGKGKEKLKGKPSQQPTETETKLPGEKVTPTPPVPTTTTPTPSTVTTTPTPSTKTPVATTTQEGKEGTLKEDVKEKAKEGIETVVNKGLEVAGSGKRLELSKEQIDTLYDRFMKLMRVIGKRERSRNVFIGVMDMLKLVEQQIAPAAEEVAGKAERSATQLRYNKHVRKTLRLAKQLVEQFTGKKSLDPLMDHIYRIQKIVRKNEEAGAYFEDLRVFVLDLLNKPDLFDEPHTRDRGKDLIERGRRLHKEKLYTHIHGVLDELNTLVKAIQEDPVTRNLRKDMKKLIKDIMLDESGNVVLKEHVLQQLRMIIVASVIERMRIPIPVIHMDDTDMEYTLRNLVISIRDLVPDRVVLETRGRVALDFSDVRQPEVEQASNVIRMVIQGVNIHMEQADIHFRRKTFPRVTDSGKLRLDIGGRGMDIVIQMQTFAKTKQIFRVQFVDVDVHDLSFYLTDTRHDWLYNAVLKLLGGRIKRNIETAIENTLTNHLELLNKMLSKQLRKAKGITGDTSVTGALKSGVSNVVHKAGGTLFS